MKAIILERNRLIARRIARIWGANSIEVICGETEEELAPHLATADLFAADIFDIGIVRAALLEHRQLRAAIWTAESLPHAVGAVVDEPRIDHVFGRARFDVTPRDWELALFARRIARAENSPITAFVAWGHGAIKEQIHTTAEIAPATDRVVRFAERLALPKRVGQMFGELAHELVMNALYDAPVDGAGRPRHAHDRRAPIALAPAEAATLRVACDGVRLVLQVVDPFGRLERRHVFEGLARGLKGQMDQSGGGAGLGLAMCAHATAALIFEVTRGQETRVTGLFDLDSNLREFRSQAKSLHFYCSEPQS